MELKDTISMMTSGDYKERFKAEYYQVKIRYEKLVAMVNKWDADELIFVPICPREIYDEQLACMMNYMHILEHRAELEGIDLND